MVTRSYSETTAKFLAIAVKKNLEVDERKILTKSFFDRVSDTDSEPGKTFKMKLFEKIVQSSILDVWLGSENVCD